eukprot:snap_masked-scaffold_13-processed-gene-4.37-mRNA-1 protein AED:1.00 eAED:1.00 QI:0/-1/0/0/-1/1/1/0/664
MTSLQKDEWVSLIGWQLFLNQSKQFNQRKSNSLKERNATKMEESNEEHVYIRLGTETSNASGSSSSKSSYEHTLTSDLLLSSERNWAEESKGNEVEEINLLKNKKNKKSTFSDIDRWYCDLYDYYAVGGLTAYVSHRLYNLVCFFFTYSAFYFLLVLFNWKYYLKERSTEMDIDSSKLVIGLRDHNFFFQIYLHIMNMSSVLFFTLFVYKTSKDFSRMKRIHKLFTNTLLINSNYSLRTLTYADLLHKVHTYVRPLPNPNATVSDLGLEISMRVMRFRNFLLAAQNLKILPKLVFSTKTTQRAVELAFYSSGIFHKRLVFDSELLANPEHLAIKSRSIGLIFLFYTPALFLFSFIYHILANLPVSLTPSGAKGLDTTGLFRRELSAYHQCSIQGINELDILFRRRRLLAQDVGNEFLSQFPENAWQWIWKSLSFVLRGTVAIVVLLNFFDERLFAVDLWGRQLIFWTALLAGLTTVTSGMLTDSSTDSSLGESEKVSVRKVCNTLHYMPKRWRNSINVDIHQSKLKNRIQLMFPFKIICVFYEVAAILYLPYLFLYVFPENMSKITSFLHRFSVQPEHLGDVCCFSTFTLKKYSDKEYNRDSVQGMLQLRDGKLEKSLLSWWYAHSKEQGLVYLENNSFLDLFQDVASVEKAVENVDSFYLQPV